MKFRPILTVFLLLASVQWVRAQVAQENRFEILRVLIADSAAARTPMPFGNDGVEVSEAGEIDEEKLREELREKGRSVEVGRVVAITEIDFDDDKIELEVDGGGEVEESFLDRISFSIGGVGGARGTDEIEQERAKGSKIVLRFLDKAPPDLTVERLRELLSPVLDFDAQNFMDVGVEAIPEEFREAVLNQVAQIGMDRSTVLRARGRPDRRVWETEEGIEQEDWIYFKIGLGADFITFENGVVVRIVRY